MRPNGAKITERARNKLTRWSPSFTHADLINLQTIPSERKTRPRYLTNFKIDAITNLHLQHSKLHGGSSEYITVFYHSECCITQCVSIFFFFFWGANEAQPNKTSKYDTQKSSDVFCFIWLQPCLHQLCDINQRSLDKGAL